MAVVIIRDPLSGISFPGLTGHRMFLYTESGGRSFSIPVAPSDISYGGIGQEWVTAERSGDRPLLLRKGVRLETLSFSFMMTSKIDMFASQSEELRALKNMAGTPERILVRYGPDEAGLWRITDCAVTSQLRHPDDNGVVRAVASLTLTRASDAAPAVGPVSGGAKNPPPAPSEPAPQRTHRVVAGDTLWGIAHRFYGNGALYPRIFDANRNIVRNANLIHIGWVLVIP